MNWWTTKEDRILRKIVHTADDLEREIARQRELAEQAMREGDADKARGHLQMAFGLESKRSDARVEQE